MATEPGLQRAVASSIGWTQKVHTISTDVADAVERALGAELEIATRGLVERNAAEALALTFRAMGLEVASQLLGNREARPEQLGTHEEIIQAAKRNLANNLGEIVIASLAELIARPNEEQAQALTAYACGYIGASLIEIDPAVREFQVTRMRKKVFILDTDFLIDCLVVDHPVYNASRHLVEAMIAAGARVVVPDDCITEAATHARLAQNTVNYFGDGIHGLTPVQARAQIQNAFAAGWYFHSQIDPIPFNRYIHNYYDPLAPIEYMRRVVRASLPAEVEIGAVGQVLAVNINKELTEKLSEALLALIRTSRKSE